MKRIKPTFLLSAALLLLLGACRHKQAQPQVIYVDSATRQHFAFKPGSYWIYKDSVSGRVDSCYVTKLDSTMLSYNNNTLIGQTIYVRFCQFPINESVVDSIHSTISLKKNGFDFFRASSNNFSEQMQIGFIYPLKTGLAYASPDSAIINKITDMSLNGNLYHDVAECYFQVYRQKERNAWIYINDSIGVIKLKTLFSEGAKVWELQRFNIIK